MTGTAKQFALVATADSRAYRRHSDIDHECSFGPQVSPFATDFISLLNCKALRRLQDKTQVMTGRLNRHIRNRRVHTDEVVANAVVLAQMLGLNVHLCAAIALGHDIGHVSMGHVGERWLAKKINAIFRHDVMSVILAQHIERGGLGLNLTHQTLEGIRLHSRGGGAMAISSETPPEYAVAMLADKIAYTLSDYNDLFWPLRGGLNESDYPVLAGNITALGPNQRERTRRCLTAVVQETAEYKDGAIHFEQSNTAALFSQIRANMFQLYEKMNFQNIAMLDCVYDGLLARSPILDGCNPALVFALLTDHDIITLASSLNPEKTFMELELAELVPFLREIGHNLNLADPDLNW